MEENARSGTTGEEARAVGENFGDSLYEIEIRLQDITEDLSKIILNGSVLKVGQAQ